MKNKTTPRSIRIPDTLWEQVTQRATAEGVPVSYVVNILLTGYGDGDLNLPQVKLVWEDEDDAPE